MPPSRPAVVLHERRAPTLGESLVEGTLPGGMRFWGLPKRGAARKMVLVAARYGSIDTRFSPAVSGGGRGAPVDTPPGVAHFLEHQLFKKSRGDLLAEFSETGADANAATESDRTEYHFSCSDALETNVDLLCETVLDPFFRTESVETEKAIIAQELKMYEDLPEVKVYTQLLAGLYQKHPVREDVGGTPDSIRKITPETLALCHTAFYHPANLHWIAAGDIDFRALAERVASAILRRGLARGGPPTNRHYPAEPSDVGSGTCRLKRPAARSKVLVGFKAPCGARTDRARVRENLLAGLALEALWGHGSRRHDRLYRAGLVDDSFGFLTVNHPTFAYAAVGGDTDEPDRLAAEIRRGMREARAERFSRQDAERLRRKYLGRYIMSFNNPDSAASMLAQYAFLDVDPFDFPALLRTAAPGALSANFLRWFSDRRCTLSIVEPLDQGAGRSSR